jgi:hypothetical protein
MRQALHFDVLKATLVSILTPKDGLSNIRIFPDQPAEFGLTTLQQARILLGE